MSDFEPLFDVALEDVQPAQASFDYDGQGPAVKQPRTKKAKKEVPRGCEPCPLNKVKGINKVIGAIHGKDMMVVAQCPGPEENEQEKELVGPSGKLLWRELKAVGLVRDDFDVLNAVKCYTADRKRNFNNGSVYLKMRSPTKQEITCCSLHTDNMMAQSQAKQILVLGQVAAKALLGVRTLPTRKVFWSEKYNAKIYLVDHPSFFLRGYGQGERFRNFRRILAQLAEERNKSGKKLSDSFAFVRKQDYKLVLNRKEAIAAKEELMATRRRIAFDLEYFPDEEGKQVLSCIGFCARPGVSRIFVINHRDVPAKDGQAVYQIAKEILEEADVHKAAHFGCSDVTASGEFGIKVETFDHDTLFSEYLRHSDKKKYGLDELMESRFPEFSGYSHIIIDDMLQGVELPPAIQNGSADVRYKYLNDNGLFNIGKLSLDSLRLYNGADCDLCKRLEIDNKKHVPQALMSLYIDLSFLLKEMEKNGPLFDYEQNEALLSVFPVKAKRSLTALREMLDWEDYNPNAHGQVKEALYERLNLVFPFEGKPDSKKITLLMLSREHEFPKLQLSHRGDARVVGTLEAYKYCAQENNGHLVTEWRGTGTRTGRLSSGGGKGKAKKKKKVNLQNIKKDPQVQNVCIADIRWRTVYRAIGRILHKFPDKAVAGSKIEAWIRKNMLDLKTYLSYDYGQVEVRVAAQMSGDENLIADCAASDIHTRVGVTMTGWDADAIKNDNATRTLTKNVHFGILFGKARSGIYSYVVAMSPVDQRDKISQEEVEQGFDRYFERYTKIWQLREDLRAFGQEHKYVETLFGMKQTLNVTDGGERDEDDEDEEVVEDEIEGMRNSWWGNQAINGPVQGTAHQLMICALVNLIRRSKRYRILGIPILEVHDALTFGVNVLDIQKAFVRGKYLLEQESLATVASDFPDIDWKVPIAVDANAGLRLGCKVDIDENVTVGDFMIRWYEKCKKQVAALNKELQELEA